MKNAENRAKTHTPQRFPAHFASFVTFPETPLPASVFTLLFEKWVRFVKIEKSKKLGSFGKIEQVGAIHELPQQKNAKNKTEIQLPQGFPAHFASFVTFPENPLPQSVVGVRFIEPDKWVRLVKTTKLEKLGSFDKKLVNSRGDRQKGGESGNLSFSRVSPFAVRVRQSLFFSHFVGCKRTARLCLLKCHEVAPSIARPAGLCSAKK